MKSKHGSAINVTEAQIGHVNVWLIDYICNQGLCHISVMEANITHVWMSD